MGKYINRWGDNGNSETLFWGLQNHCRWWHEIKRCLLLGRKVMTNLDSILKSRDITFPTKVRLVKAMVFSSRSHVMDVSESLTIRKAERQKTDAFELWHWRRLLRVPWTARKSNQSILKEISPEAPILWPPDAKNWLIWKDPDAGKGWRQEEKGMTEDEMVGWHHRLNGHEFKQVRGIGQGQESLACWSPWGSQRVRHDWVTELNLE